MNDESIDFELPDLAYTFIEAILKKHGNKVSKQQAIELHKILNTAATTISLQQGTRHASPLPCGAGKTTAIRGLIKAIHTLKRKCRIVVCAEKVEALC